MKIESDKLQEEAEKNDGDAMSSPMVSVIVPVYNVKRFLLKGLERVMSQTFDDYEVLLIDDGSTDGCAELCDEFAAQHHNVTVWHKPNGGLGSARNMGFDKAQGTYVYVCDMDDAVRPWLLQYCVERMERTQAEVLVFSFCTVEVAFGGRREDVRLAPCEVTSNAQLRDVWADSLLFTPNGNGFVWNKFYRRDFLNRYHLRNSTLSIQQDEEFNSRVWRYAQRVSFSDEVLYDYYIYGSGNNASRFLPNRFDIYKAVNCGFRDLLDFWQLHDERVEEYLKGRFYSDGVTKCLNFNLFNPKCLWTIAEKKAELHRIMTDDLTREVVEWKRKTSMGLEGRIAFYCYTHERIGLLYLFVKTTSYLRKLKYMIQYGRK